MKVRYSFTISAIILLLFIFTGCSSVDKGTSLAEDQTPGTVELRVEGGSYIPALTQPVQIRINEGLTVHDAIDRVAEFNEGSNAIASVGSYVLDESLEWRLKLNDEDIGSDAWGNSLDSKDSLILYIQPIAKIENMEPSAVTLTIYGGVSQPDLRGSIASLYFPNLTVRDILEKNERIQLTDNKRYVHSIDGYVPLITERWKIEVNNKELMDNGLDMVLSPRDEIRLELAERQ
ncbi:hypothetical protein PUW24_25350 [Paenibacillus urinalis]|uniref:Uncharacterized protein n=1 Tax=Paenibacillus urinalis TaxID=521520 RepID=A0ABY7X8X5_9BACL|nr:MULTISPECIES: hypothetical protein [Paenibacillus]OMC68804.1 hypothetical protein BK126_13440 [Paenibacillus sp. FSL H7-0326]WDH97411.1 hypothetical protein PUW24_25350 [Paenibacillus urinalis]WDI01077.1 hypothetical protein PUW25_17585 [Paenibacillus urinalis]GAK39871.1 hypothetical protein TCA2_2360 [Paenibacillus sp. TCA20]